MTAEVVLDTNVLVYAVDSASSASHKREIARRLIAEGRFGVSGQILQEFYVTVTRKLKRPLTTERAVRWVEQLARRPFVAVDAGLIKIAIARSARYQISYWDGAIIAAAEALGATTVYTEDLSHGQSYGPVRAVNPFIER